MLRMERILIIWPRTSVLRRKWRVAFVDVLATYIKILLEADHQQDIGMTRWSRGSECDSI